MCGICGFVGLDDKILLKRMCKIIHHRGPNDQGIFTDKNIGLGNNRLSIIDINLGHQPIHNEDQSIWVTYNGEIYNYKELKENLEKKGHKFYTSSDTEVIVHAYEEFGENCVNFFRGMFAFAIWDGNKKKLILARDRLGIKPLYYTVFNSQLIFSSEIKSILQLETIPREIDHCSLYNFLTFRYVPGPRTMFKDIKKIQPGHILTYENGAIKIKKYWDLFFTSSKISETQCIKNLKEIIEESIKLRLISEVPIGAYLSGGTDSSYVVGVMSSLMDEPVKTFTVGFGDERFDETKYANIVAEQFNTDHHEFIIEPPSLETLGEVIWYFDEPIADPAAIPTYLLSRLAKKYVTVILTGEGGDELFAGYEQYKIMSITTKIRRLSPNLPISKIMSKLIKIIPKKILDPFFMYTSSLGDQAINRFIEYMNSLNDLYKSYFLIISIFTEKEKDFLFSNKIKQSTKKFNIFDEFKQYFRDVNGKNLLNNLLLFESKIQLPDNLLMKVDKMTMAWSIEARVPLLDHKLVEFAATIPQNFKLNKFTDKYILRKTMKDFLPKEIIKRQKHRFAVPIDIWFKGELGDIFNQIFSESNIKKRGYFEYKHIRYILNNFQKSKLYYSRQLWSLLNFEFWYKIFIDQDNLKCFKLHL